MNPDYLPDMQAVQAMLAGTVTDRCETVDKKGHRCGLPKHQGPVHSRMAQPGEPPYLPGVGNSIITWTGATG